VGASAGSRKHCPQCPGSERGRGSRSRGVTAHCDLYEKLGINTAGTADDTRAALRGTRGVNVLESVTINRPIELLYRFWRNLENLPRFMNHLESVAQREGAPRFVFYDGPPFATGLPHYGLEADLAPMCSPACVEGTREAMDDLVRASKPKGWFRWLDSYRVDGVNDALVIYPRMGATVDVMEVLGAINSIGFEASALTLQTHGSR